MTLTARYRAPDGRLDEDVPEESVPGLLRGESGLLWVDIVGPGHEDMLRDVFGFHPLTLRVVSEPGVHPTRMEAFDSYTCVVAHGAADAGPGEVIAITELSIFIGAHYVVEVRGEGLACADRIRERLARDPSLMARGPARLALAILEELAADARAVFESLEDLADDYEVLAIDEPRREILRTILLLKRSGLRLERMLDQQVDMIGRLSGNPHFDEEEAGQYARDLLGRLDRLWNTSRILLDRADNLLALYLSAVSVKQNETMKTLALVAAIFLPLSLIAGIYGMNFENMPELDVHWAYFAVLGVMGVLGTGIAAVTIWRRGD